MDQILGLILVGLGFSGAASQNVLGEVSDRIQMRFERRATKSAEIQERQTTRVTANASRLTEKLAQLNTRRTAQMTKNLTVMSNILKKVSERAEKASGEGVNVTSVETAVASAESAIETAQAAVAVQAGKSYTVDTSASNLGAAIRNAIAQMKNDHKSVHDLIVSARKAVRTALVAMATVLGEPVPDPSTSSGQAP